MTTICEVRLEFGRTVTDGNYGSERLSVGLVATVDDDEDAGAILADLFRRAREEVLGRLKSSETEGVRLALETREEREARWARELAERQAK